MKKIIMLVLLVVCSMLFIVGCGDKQLKFNGALNLTESKYKNINLIIRQEDSYDSVNYIFENNKWDKDV
ncbi:hypothetical protein [Paraclostridium sordellii]|uniref:Lipoprotein n=1 Tax=Paraclostridium sordellii TaxID=1505 RepID=A0A9P1L0R0_PARSO|nr:hypothetical protein [Paeniclostridium sordellii]CEN31415.1 Uncharacterised protein [[Clostridium] sordellii] [Paeniclostridium sordellii]